MNTPQPGFEITCIGTTAIVSPSGNVGELSYAELETAIAGAMQQFEQLSEIRNIVIDLEQTDYFGSSALGLFVRLSKRVQERRGRMVLCHVSEHEEEILRVSQLQSLWPVCPDRDAALKAVGEMVPPENQSTAK